MGAFLGLLFEALRVRHFLFPLSEALFGHFQITYRRSWPKMITSKITRRLAKAVRS